MLRVTLGTLLLLLPPTMLPDPTPTTTCCASDRTTPAVDRLEIIKRMAGTWVALDDHDAPTEKVVSKFVVTAGGSAVLEILFPGTPEEMVSVYSVDGDRLMMDHYCLMGNQPRYEAKLSADGKTIDWLCQGGGNLADHQRAHMHQGVTRLLSDDRMDGDWTATQDGATIMRENFRLVRQQNGAK